MANLTLNQLSRTFGPYRAVDGVDLVVKDGEFLALLGPVGCGRTTLIRLIAGLVDPSGGSVAVDGRALSTPKYSAPPEARGMAMIFQSVALWPNMTVVENVAFGLRLRRTDQKDMARRVGTALDRVEMHDFAGRMPAQLSPAQKQRVALARAIVVEPSILLLDEPLSTIDAHSRADLGALIRSLHDALHLTTIYVTGDRLEATSLADRMAVMNRGRIEQVDTPQAIYALPRTRFVAAFTGPTNFLEGRRKGNRIAFDGFSIESARFGKIAANAEPLTFSVRPQSLQLSTEEAPTGEDVVALAGRVLQRRFAGERWTYNFAVANSALRFDVAAQIMQVLQVGQAARLLLDPQQMVVVR